MDFAPAEGRGYCKHMRHPGALGVARAIRQHWQHLKSGLGMANSHPATLTGLAGPGKEQIRAPKPLTAPGNDPGTAPTHPLFSSNNIICTRTVLLKPSLTTDLNIITLSLNYMNLST